MKRVCGFAISHIVSRYYAALYRVAWSIGLSVALSVCHTSEPCKNGLTDQFAVWVVDSSGPKDAQIQLYSPGGANVPSWEDTLLSPVE